VGGIYVCRFLGMGRGGSDGDVFTGDLWGVCVRLWWVFDGAVFEEKWHVVLYK